MGARCCSTELPSRLEPEVMGGRGALTSPRTVSSLSSIRSLSRYKTAYQEKGPLVQVKKVLEVSCRATQSKYVCRKLPKSQMPTKSMAKVSTHCQALNALEHPHICKFIEAFQDERYLYMIYEKADPTTLFDHIAQGKNSQTEEAADYVRQAVQALVVAHGQGVAHGLLSPSSLILAIPDAKDEEEAPAQVKICDLGQAFVLRPHAFLDEAGEAFNDPAREPLARKHYCSSPELVQSELGPAKEGAAPPLSSYHDVWSLGCIVYHMLTGAPPFKSCTKQDMTRRTSCGIQFAGDAWARVPPEAQDAVEAMLKLNAKLRITASGLLRHPWIRVAKTTFPRKRMRMLLENLKSNLGAGEFKRFVLRVIAEQLPSDAQHVQTVENAFRCLDANGDGVLTVEELSRGMQKYLETCPGELDALFAQLDRDGSGTLNISEFVTATMDQKRTTSAPVLWQAFNAFDKDQGGSIAFDEIDRIVQEIEGGLLSKDQVHELCRQIRAELETAGHGTEDEMDFDQFVYVMGNRDGSFGQALQRDTKRFLWNVCGVDGHNLRHHDVAEKWDLRKSKLARSPRSVYRHLRSK